MLAAVEEFIPELLPFIHSAYCSLPFLLWGEDVINSFEGVQQEDPLGPLLFCSAFHKLCAKIKLKFAVFYLDDSTMGGHRDIVLQDMMTIKKAVANLSYTSTVERRTHL